MMDPYNLAICFGPTLLPIPPDRDQVSYQASVNEIIKTIIIHQEEIFPNDGGETYEKCILENSRYIRSQSFEMGGGGGGIFKESCELDHENSRYQEDLIKKTFGWGGAIWEGEKTFGWEGEKTLGWGGAIWEGGENTCLAMGGGGGGYL